MMKNLTIFKNKKFGQIRTCMVDGETYFVGKDVAEALGYKKPLDAIAKHVEPEDSVKRGLLDKRGCNQKTIIINESGLYALIRPSFIP